MKAMVAALLVCSLGCGLTMTRGPDPRTPPDQRPACTETFEAPKRDGVAALLGLITLFVGVAFERSDGDNEDLGTPLIVGGVTVMAAAYLSGGIGYFRIKRCQKAIADYEARMGVPPAANVR